jgi:hypothetical protein
MSDPRVMNEESFYNNKKIVDMHREIHALEEVTVDTHNVYFNSIERPSFVCPRKK